MSDQFNLIQFNPISFALSLLYRHRYFLDSDRPLLTVRRGAAYRALPACNRRQMSRSPPSAALLLLLLLLLSVAAALFAAAESEEPKFLDDGVVSVENATDLEAGRNRSLAKEDTFADMIDRALAKEFTENEDQPQGFA